MAQNLALKIPIPPNEENSSPMEEHKLSPEEERVSQEENKDSQEENKTSQDDSKTTTPVESQVDKFLRSCKEGNLREVQNIAAKMDVTLISDNNKYTGLHVACLNNQTHIASFLIDWVRLNIKENQKDESPRSPHYRIASERITPRDQRLSKFINQKTNEGFTALHFACFKGNLQLVKILVSKGSWLHLKNAQGLTYMHVAAQADQVTIMAYLREQNVKINEQDHNGSTPLHWAAYLGCELAVLLLLSWGFDVECSDLDGLTPLHLGTMAGNIRIVRYLLMKGANRNAKDLRNRTPINIAEENQMTALIPLLRPPGLSEKIGFKTPLAPYSEDYCSFLTFIILYILGNFSIYSFIDTRNSDLLSTLHLIIFWLTITFFIIVVKKDPGYIQKSSQTLLQLYERHDPNLVCPTCIVFRPPRSRHCHCCNRCVRKFDHHCPWIRNCVGDNNHKWFVAFVSLVATSLLIDLTIITWSFINDIIQEKYFYLLVCGIMILISSTFLFPVLVLLYVQLKNLILDQTTSERFSKQQKLVHNSQSNQYSNRSEMEESSNTQGQASENKIKLNETTCFCINSNKNVYKKLDQEQT